MFNRRTVKVAIWPRPHAQSGTHQAENGALVEAARQFCDHLDVNLPFRRGARALFTFASSEGADPEMAHTVGDGHTEWARATHRITQMPHTVGFSTRGGYTEWARIAH